MTTQDFSFNDKELYTLKQEIVLLQKKINKSFSDEEDNV